MNDPPTALTRHSKGFEGREGAPSRRDAPSYRDGRVLGVETVPVSRAAD